MNTTLIPNFPFFLRRMFFLVKINDKNVIFQSDPVLNSLSNVTTLNLFANKKCQQCKDKLFSFFCYSCRILGVEMIKFY